MVCMLSVVYAGFFTPSSQYSQAVTLAASVRPGGDTKKMRATWLLQSPLLSFTRTVSVCRPGWRALMSMEAPDDNA